MTSERALRVPLAGKLVIPFDSPERFHLWNGGQTVKATREAVKTLC